MLLFLSLLKYQCIFTNAGKRVTDGTDDCETVAAECRAAEDHIPVPQQRREPLLNSSHPGPGALGSKSEWEMTL